MCETLSIFLHVFRTNRSVGGTDAKDTPIGFIRTVVAGVSNAYDTGAV